MKSIMVGIDLHSNNLMVAMVDPKGVRLGHKKLVTSLKGVLDYLQPHRELIDTIAVESTFNWYWLVDGLVSHDYKVALANPAAIRQFDGIKKGDDKTDAYFLAELLRLEILPTGYIYDPKTRPIRDLLRRRASLVRMRTALLLSFKSHYMRTTGDLLPLCRIKSMETEDAGQLYEHPANQQVAQIQKQSIDHLTEQIETIEKYVLTHAKVLPMYQQLTRMPGIGVILGLTITMEVGAIERFPSPEDFASYCRTVDATRSSNDKKKGENNRKCGNKHLAWAFVEAANYAKRFDKDCRRWFDRKAAQTCTVVATKALACKMAKAAWHMIKNKSEYDGKRMFPGAAQVVAAK